MMRKTLIIIIVAISFNFLILSIGYSQSNVNIGGIVPETELNRNTKKGYINLNQSSVPEENKYLYWFEKTLGLAKDKDGNVNQVEAQTSHDRIYSSLILWILMFLAAVLTYCILKLLDRYVFRLNKSRKVIRAKKRN